MKTPYALLHVLLYLSDTSLSLFPSIALHASGDMSVTVTTPEEGTACCGPTVFFIWGNIYFSLFST